MAAHTIFDGRLQIYKRGGKYWNCAAMVGGQRFRQTTKQESLERAKDVAEEWYLELRGKLREGKIVPKEKTFREAAEAYLAEAKVLAATVRSPKYVSGVELRLNAHILPFFGPKPLSAINKGLVQSYRVKRAEETIAKTEGKDEDGKLIKGKPPARSTMLQEIVVIRQVLKHAEGLGWIPFVPNLSTAYMTQGKRGRRAWFSHEDYAKLIKATRKRITEGKRPGWKKEYEDLHDFVVFMVNTGLRPDEAWTLEYRDVKTEYDYATKQTILVLDVRGKTGTGFCKSMPQAVFHFEQVRDRLINRLREVENKTDKEIEDLLPTMKVFPNFRRDLFNQILKEEKLKHDRDGQVRTAYSLRHTYISMRLMEGANIYQIANNCRTSVEMIQEFYANHIKDRLDASAINVMRSKPARKAALPPKSDGNGDKKRP